MNENKSCFLNSSNSAARTYLLLWLYFLPLPLFSQVLNLERWRLWSPADMDSNPSSMVQKSVPPKIKPRPPWVPGSPCESGNDTASHRSQRRGFLLLQLTWLPSPVGFSPSVSSLSLGPCSGLCSDPLPFLPRLLWSSLAHLGSLLCLDPL